ncbi:MAG TPA: hypothetical protein VK644_11820 [Chitinophagaceae bacterium]|nr:hypothetical protein [Chitinophagaceae bacterium]
MVNTAGLLPPQEIRVETSAGKRIWVHLDSGKATLLSTIPGETIDRLCLTGRSQQ